MKHFLTWIFVVLLSFTLWAQAAPPEATTKATPATKRHVAKKKAAKAAPKVSEIKVLRDTLDSQQQQIQQLRDQLQQRDTALQQVQTQLSGLQSTVNQAQSTAQNALSSSEQTATNLGTVQGAVTDLKTGQGLLDENLKKTDKRVNYLEEPASIAYKGVKITPGGYAQFAAMYRTKNANSDTADSYGAFPYNNSANAHLSEFRASGRASRLSMKFEGKLSENIRAMGYTEIDFLGAAPSANESQTNSFQPRLRLAFANVALPGGWQVAGGQNWSMIQTTRKGIDPLSEWLPALIDNSYTPGFSYAREGTIRVVKEIVPNKAWFGLSVENPDTVASVACQKGTSLGSCNNLITNGAIQGLANGPNTLTVNGYANTVTSVSLVQTNAAGTSPTVVNTVTGNPSTNIAPDVVVKFAIEPGWGHYEVKGIGRFFRDRAYLGCSPNAAGVCTNSGAALLASNQVTEGWGIGAGAILPVVKNKVDVDLQALGGHGIGRFGTTGGPDVTINPVNGELIPIKALQGIGGVELHPTPKLDVDIYGGAEYYGRVSYSFSNTQKLFGGTVQNSTFTAASPYTVGYGSPLFNNSGCQTEGGTCTGNARSIWAIQPAIWYRFYKGKAGSLQLGASYAYVHKTAWAGVASTGSVSDSTGSLVNTGISAAPNSIENIAMTSFRYYLP